MPMCRIISSGFLKTKMDGGEPPMVRSKTKWEKVINDREEAKYLPAAMANRVRKGKASR